MSTVERLAFVAPRFAEGGTVGGAETLLRNLAERASVAGRQVTFLTTCATNHFTWENALPAGSRRIGNMDVRFFPVDDSRDVEKFLKVQEAICRRGVVSRDDELAWIGNSINSPALCAHLETEGAQYDRVLVGPYLFGLTYAVARIAPRKTLLVPCLHDEPFAQLGIIREMFDAVRGFVFNSEPEMSLARRSYGIDETKCAVVGMGIDPFDVDRAAFAARRGLTSPYVIYSGRRESGKGTPLLTGYVYAFRERTGIDLELVFTGSGPIEGPPALTPHILDVGFVSEQEKHEAMAGATAFVHPSTLESLGIVLLEAFLAGTPALVHAGSEVLRWQCNRSGGGLWFRTYPEFEEELLLLLNNKPLREAMGTSAKKYVQDEYSWEKVQARFDRALTSL